MPLDAEEGDALGRDTQALIELIDRKLTERRLLVVMDSLSSYVDQSIESRPGNDAFAGLGQLKALMMWAINVRRCTEGEIAFPW